MSGVFDAFGRPLQEGDLVIVTTPTAQVYRIGAITPNLVNPQAPGELVLGLEQHQAVKVQAGQRQAEMLLVLRPTPKPDGEQKSVVSET